MTKMHKIKYTCGREEVFSPQPIRGDMGKLKILLPFFLIWNAIAAIFVIIASMRSAQISRREEVQYEMQP
ncbi:MAG: hypothetical protein KC413_17670 [Anaerolineales bacterium]|nr:hypothetical protein [Anaerolineales bacterium]MCA9977595.1 hypothetical protein [Anaerolineales bacterium]MCB8965414.1 hypothetical protein [Ardenticatenaceae bacterium]